jgi:hypothetical protein
MSSNSPSCTEGVSLNSLYSYNTDVKVLPDFFWSDQTNRSFSNSCSIYNEDDLKQIFALQNNLNNPVKIPPVPKDVQNEVNEIQFKVLDKSYSEKFKKASSLSLEDLSANKTYITENSKWAYPTLSQGILGDCFANATCAGLVNGFASKLVRDGNEADAVKVFINEYLPSRALYTNMFYRSRSQFLPNLSRFQQGGNAGPLLSILQRIANQSGVVTELQYSYPEIVEILSKLNIEDSENYLSNFFKTYSPQEQQIYLTEYFEKFYGNVEISYQINNLFRGFQMIYVLPDSDFVSFPFIQYPFKLNGFSQKKNKNGLFLFYDDNGHETYEATECGVPQTTSTEIKDLYRQVIISKYTLIFSIPYFDNFPQTNLSKGIPKDASDYKYEIYPVPTSENQLLGGHCIQIYDIDDEHEMFICMNSFGPDFGENGIFAMPYQWIDWFFQPSNICQKDSLSYVAHTLTVHF